MEAAGISSAVALEHHDDEHEHHGPPPANRSSRVEPELLGMLLFIISTLPATRSGWMRADLISRVKKASNIEVEHIVAEPEPAGKAH